MNKQREVIYARRKKILEEENLRPVACDMIKDAVNRSVDIHINPGDYPENWDLETLSNYMTPLFSTDIVTDIIDRKKFSESKWDISILKEKLAGRGTDIVLGEGVVELGGLHVFGTERHESRRIDNQLRGRSGRQGDIGSSQFYLSTEDDLLRLFGSGRIYRVMETFNFPDDLPIQHPIISRAIENAQRQVEGRNFEIRKHVLEYDDVMNKQREVIYARRKKILEEENLRPVACDMIKDAVNRSVDIHINPGDYPENWDLETLSNYMTPLFSTD
ncbi:unnamed protein product, partial [marine sediment metagenome]